MSSIKNLVTTEYTMVYGGKEFATLQEELVVSLAQVIAVCATGSLIYYLPDVVGYFFNLKLADATKDKRF